MGTVLSHGQLSGDRTAGSRMATLPEASALSYKRALMGPMPDVIRLSAALSSIVTVAAACGDGDTATGPSNRASAVPGRAREQRDPTAGGHVDNVHAVAGPDQVPPHLCQERGRDGRQHMRGPLYVRSRERAGERPASGLHRRCRAGVRSRSGCLRFQQPHNGVRKVPARVPALPSGAPRPPHITTHLGDRPGGIVDQGDRRPGGSSK